MSEHLFVITFWFIEDFTAENFENNLLVNWELSSELSMEVVRVINDKFGIKITVGLADDSIDDIAMPQHIFLAWKINWHEFITWINCSQFGGTGKIR